MQRRTWCLLLIAFVALTAGWARGGPAAAQTGSRYFPQTGHTVQGRFLEYWDSHGGLAQQGYPLTEEQREVSPTDGKTYTVQYFERAVFEYHPENPVPYDVLLSLLGVFQYDQRYGPIGAPNQHANGDFPHVFTETGHTIGGSFREYWESHGALPQQGYPISDEFTEVSALDGKAYTVQYFQRAVFEYHPENQVPYKVLLSQLGTFRLAARGGGPVPTSAPPPLGTPTPRPVTDLSGIAMLIGHDIVGEPMVQGSFLVWAARKPGGGFALYGRDLEHGTAGFTIADPLGQRPDVGNDGRLAVWLEPAPGGLWRLRAYDMIDRRISTVFDRLPSRAYGRFSYRGDGLAYEDTNADHKGLWTVDPTNPTSSETLISPTGVRPVGGRTVLLWQEPGGAAGGWDLRLHMTRPQAVDRSLAMSPSGFSGYDFTGYAVWAAQPAAGMLDSAARVQLLGLYPPAGTPQELSTGGGLHPMIKGFAVAWTETNAGKWILQVYNQTRGNTQSLLGVVTADSLQVCGILEGLGVAFTVSNGATTDLYLHGMPGDFPPP
jgi:hypothetical protein